MAADMFANFHPHPTPKPTPGPTSGESLIAASTDHLVLATVALGIVTLVLAAGTIALAYFAFRTLSAARDAARYAKASAEASERTYNLEATPGIVISRGNIVDYPAPPNYFVIEQIGNDTTMKPPVGMLGAWIVDDKEPKSAASMFVENVSRTSIADVQIVVNLYRGRLEKSLVDSSWAPVLGEVERGTEETISIASIVAGARFGIVIYNLVPSQVRIEFVRASHARPTLHGSAKERDQLAFAVSSDDFTIHARRTDSPNAS